MASAFKRTISASEFKATCLELMDQAHNGCLREIHVTKRGKPYMSFEAKPAGRIGEEWFDAIPKLITIPDDVDVTAPVIDIADIEAIRGWPRD